MGPEIVAPMGFFATVVILAFMFLRHRERESPRGIGASPLAGELLSRMERMEQAIDAIAVEVERISEGQRFTTRLLSERRDAPPLAEGEAARARVGGA